MFILFHIFLSSEFTIFKDDRHTQYIPQYCDDEEHRYWSTCAAQPCSGGLIRNCPRGHARFAWRGQHLHPHLQPSTGHVINLLSVKTLHHGHGRRALFSGSSTRNTRWGLRDFPMTSMLLYTLERSIERLWPSPKTHVGHLAISFVLLIWTLSCSSAGSTASAMRTLWC
jgi:hypothetical protein